MRALQALVFGCGVLPYSATCVSISELSQLAELLERVQNARWLVIEDFLGSLNGLVVGNMHWFDHLYMSALDPFSISCVRPWFVSSNGSPSISTTS